MSKIIFYSIHQSGYSSKSKWHTFKVWWKFKWSHPLRIGFSNIFIIIFLFLDLQIYKFSSFWHSIPIFFYSSRQFINFLSLVLCVFVCVLMYMMVRLYVIFLGSFTLYKSQRSPLWQMRKEKNYIINAAATLPRCICVKNCLVCMWQVKSSILFVGTILIGVSSLRFEQSDGFLTSLFFLYWVNDETFEEIRPKCSLHFWIESFF